MEDTKTFKNPTGYWTHEGGYTVEITDNTPINLIPSSITVTDHILTVLNGSCYQSVGGICLVTAQGNKFRFSYNHMKAIRRLDGTPIWVNWNYQ
ncbi:MAG: hypothetical protein WCF92_00480 [bacterium]